MYSRKKVQFQVLRTQIIEMLAIFLGFLSWEIVNVPSAEKLLMFCEYVKNYYKIIEFWNRESIRHTWIRFSSYYIPPAWYTIFPCVDHGLPFDSFFHLWSGSVNLCCYIKVNLVGINWSSKSGPLVYSLRWVHLLCVGDSFPFCSRSLDLEIIFYLVFLLGV